MAYDWIEWHGGKQPVADGIEVEVVFGEGDDVSAPADFFDWAVHGDAMYDIVKYRVKEGEFINLVDDEIINDLVDACHGASRAAGWYNNPKTGEAIERNVPEMLCLIHSEISEAMEGYRKSLMDDHLTERKMIEVELADAVIRIADLCGYLGLDLGVAIVDKMAYNENREDHKIENRKNGGKAF